MTRQEQRERIEFLLEELNSAKGKWPWLELLQAESMLMNALANITVADCIANGLR